MSYASTWRIAYQGGKEENKPSGMPISLHAFWSNEIKVAGWSKPCSLRTLSKVARRPVGSILRSQSTRTNGFGLDRCFRFQNQRRFPFAYLKRNRGTGERHESFEMGEQKARCVFPHPCHTITTPRAYQSRLRMLSCWRRSSPKPAGMPISSHLIWFNAINVSGRSEVGKIRWLIIKGADQKWKT